MTDNNPLRMVTLTLLADRDYLALARTSAMHVGALLFLPLAQVQDLRLAVDEACSSFLQSMRHADADAAMTDTMEISYDRYPAALHVIVRAPAPHDWPERDELGWALLGSLVGDVSVSVEDGIGTLTLVEPLPSGAQPSSAV
ncbi:ATP-binding protein [Actinospica sp.]|uniref:ATP-binding protein n=1 Tax=Actinospica sp. TaxID=1872142 RepID=UPI002CB0DC63|nr:ATP-binding protein [Actinospica sp.]HWG28874.1 ATP-binding protein [Actinospica sp.]